LIPCTPTHPWHCSRIRIDESEQYETGVFFLVTRSFLSRFSRYLSAMVKVEV